MLYLLVTFMIQQGSVVKGLRDKILSNNTGPRKLDVTIKCMPKVIFDLFWTLLNGSYNTKIFICLS